MSDEWRSRAACVYVDAELFHAPDLERSDSPAATERIAAAKAVCATCPVRAECLQDAIDTRDGHGIRGGLTEGERANLTRRQKRAARTPHGTLGGYRAHYRRRETPCDACRDANREYQREHNAARPKVDDVLVARGIEGHADTLSRQERIEVVRALAAQGFTDRQIAERVARSVRQVSRIRAAHNIESKWAA